MKTWKIFLFSAVLSILIFSSYTLANDNNCSFLKNISFKSFKKISLNEYELKIDQLLFKGKFPDDPENPKTWETLEVLNQTSVKDNKISLGLVTKIFYIESNKTLIALSYSGSTNYIHIYNCLTYKKIIEDVEYYGKDAKVKDCEIFAQPLVYCPKDEKICYCDPAKIISFNKNLFPYLNSKKSAKITKKIIGIEIKGSTKVLNPGTKNVKIVE